LRFVVITIFPEFFDGALEVGLLGKAVESGLLEVVTVSPREFTVDRHRTVDDTPYGGGPGMVMLLEPLVAALEFAAARYPENRRILLSPQGTRFHQAMAQELASLDTIFLVCGRYEGVDQRLVDGGYVHQELSIGDYVLNGGEVAALVVIEACSRLLPGMVGNQESVEQDSFSEGIFDHPHYSRPRDYRGLSVPEVLLSGNHAAIRRWRDEEARRRTRNRRPELLTEP